MAITVEVIKWEPQTSEGNDIIVYKHDSEDFSCAAQLLVAPSQVALFVNEGEVVPFLPGHYTLDESNNSKFGFINRWRSRHSGGVSSFHCSVYFINMVFYNDLRFGTQNPIQMQDADEGVNIHVRAAGLFGAHINNDDKDGKDVIKFFTKVVGTRKCFTKDELAAYLRGKIVERVTDLLGQTMVESKIGILRVSSHYSELSDSIMQQMIPYFAEFGVSIDNFSFVSINAPDEDLKAINEAKINAKKMDLESEAMARKRAREGYSYQQERGFDVLGTAAANEASSGQFMGAGMGLGMGIGVGGAFGGAMGQMAQGAFGSMNQPVQQAQKTLCPKCGIELASGAKFCANCGEKIGASAVCPECGAELVNGAKFCANCGKKISSTCPKCGTELAGGAKFCANCGEKLN